VKVKTHDNGEMNYEDFEQKLTQNMDKPVIINANLGTTMKGATDNTREIYRIICKHNKQSSYFMHADGALMGFVLPFIERDVFFKKCIHSISISSHKFLGVPFPCGVFMMEKRFLDYINKNHIEYIDNNDCTIAGSRNGHSALFMDYIINQKGKDGFKDDIMGCIKRAEELINKLNDLGMNAWRNQNSITVVFDRPTDAIIKKWQLASQGKHSHAVVLPHVSQEYIERFVNDIIPKVN
jgi:histidine decarboxylase